MARHRTVLTLTLSAAVLAADLIAQQPAASSAGVPLQPLAQYRFSRSRNKCVDSKRP